VGSVLLTIGFVFLPASTLPEKMYVLFTCLALSAACVTGIGAWRSARRFGLTAASVCVAVVCLTMNNIIASQPPRSTFTLAGVLVIKQSSSDLSNGGPNFSKTAQGCQGTGGYSDLAAGRRWSSRTHRTTRSRSAPCKPGNSPTGTATGA
jgi:hypothetical protein